MLMTGAEIIVEVLIEQGVADLFGYPGGTVLNIFDALYDRQDRINLYLTAHEQGAAHAADGYARATGHRHPDIQGCRGQARGPLLLPGHRRQH